MFFTEKIDLIVLVSQDGAELGEKRRRSLLEEWPVGRIRIEPIGIERVVAVKPICIVLKHHKRATYSAGYSPKDRGAPEVLCSVIEDVGAESCVERVGAGAVPRILNGFRYFSEICNAHFQVERFNVDGLLGSISVYPVINCFDEHQWVSIR